MKKKYFCLYNKETKQYTIGSDKNELPKVITFEATNKAIVRGTSLEDAINRCPLTAQDYTYEKANRTRESKTPLFEEVDEW